MKRALKADARGLILFYKHPGGTSRTRQEDIDLSARMAEACSPPDNKILAHYLIPGKNSSPARKMAGTDKQEHSSIHE